MQGPSQPKRFWQQIWEFQALTTLRGNRFSLPFLAISISLITVLTTVLQGQLQIYLFFLYGIPIVYGSIIFNLRTGVKIAFLCWVMTGLATLPHFVNLISTDGQWGDLLSSFLLGSVYFLTCVVFGRMLINERDAQLRYKTLAEKYAQSNRELTVANRNIYRAYTNTIRALAAAIEAKDSYTKGHVERVTNYVVAMAREMKLPRHKVRELMYASLLHDVGKIGIPEAILGKPGRLSDDEYTAIKLHPEIGATIIASIPVMDNIIPFVRHHHEHYNGRGYPEGLAEGEIPFGARLIAVADAYDAMVSERPYRPPFTKDYAVGELKRCSGTQFDPDAVDIFMQVLKKENENQDRYDMVAATI